MEHSRFNLSRWALEHQPLTRYLLVVLLLGGLLAFFQLGQDEDPPFTFRVMVVQAFWPGATAEQIAEMTVLAAEAVTERGGGDDPGGERQPVGVHCPFQGGDAAADAVVNGWQRGDHDERVQRHHEERHRG